MSKPQKAPSTGAQTELGTEQPQLQAVPIPIYSTYAPTTATATPGPWQLSASGVLITAEHDGVVTHIAEIVESGVCAPSPREAQANAALIASAPELLCERDQLRSELAYAVDAYHAEKEERRASQRGAEKLRAEVESLRAACLEAINDCTAASVDKDRRILARAASAACVDKLRTALAEGGQP